MNRYTNPYPERKLPGNPKYKVAAGKDSATSTKGSRAEKSNSAVKDSPVGYNLKGLKERGYSLNSGTKWPIIKITVDEKYDGDGD